MSFKMSQKKTLIVVTVLIVGIYFCFVGFSCAGITTAYGAEDKDKNIRQENVEMNKELGSGQDTRTNEEIKGKKKEENKGKIEGTSETNKQGEVKKNAEKEKKILKVEYKEGLLSVDLQNVEIVDVLKIIGEKATIEIDIGPGIEGKIEKMHFEELSIRDAMAKLIEASGRGIVVEYSEEKAKRIRVGKKLGDKVLKKEEPTKKVTTIPDSWPVDIIKRIKVKKDRKDLYLKYTNKSKVDDEKYPTRYLFFDRNGKVVKEVIEKPIVSSIIKREGKNYSQTTAMWCAPSRNGKYLAIVETLFEGCDEYNPNFHDPESPYKKLKGKLTYYDNEGKVLFEKDNYFFTANTLYVDPDGDFIIIAENNYSDFMVKTIKDFDQRVHIYDKKGNELFRYDCEDSVFSFYKRDGNKYIVGLISGRKEMRHLRIIGMGFSFMILCGINIGLNFPINLIHRFMKKKLMIREILQ